MVNLTIAQIAREIGCPESTVRYYRDRFPAYVPSIGEGRSRRYPPEALEVLRFIAANLRHDTGIRAEDLEAALSSRFALLVDPQGEPQPETQTAAAGTQQQASAGSQQAVVLRSVLAETLGGLLAEQSKGIAALAEQNEGLRSEVAGLRSQVADLTAAVQALATPAAPIAAEASAPKRRWWWPW